MSQLIDKIESRNYICLTKLFTDDKKPFLDKAAALENKISVYEAHFKALDEKMDVVEYRCKIKVDDI